MTFKYVENATLWNTLLLYLKEMKAVIYSCSFVKSLCCPSATFGLYIRIFLSANSMQHIVIYLFTEIVLSRSYQSNDSNISNCNVCETAYISLKKCLQLPFCFAFLKQLILVSLLHISDPLNMKVCTEAHSISCDLVY